LFGPLTLGLFVIIFILLLLKSKFKTIGLIRIPLLLLSFFIIYIDTGTWKGLVPACSLLGVLSLLKLFEYDKQRDYFSFIFIFQLFTLSLSIQVEEFYYLIVIGLSVFLSFYALYKTMDHDLGKVGLIYLARLVFKSLPFMIILLTVFPRFQFGGIFFTENFAKTGFSDSLIPGEVRNLINDPTEIFTAEISFPIKRESLYWRGAVLTKNNHFSWEKGPVEDTNSYKSKKGELKYSVQYSDLWNGPLFTLANTSHVLLKSKSILRKNRGGVYSTTSLMDQKVRFVATIDKEKTLKKFPKFNQVYLETNILKSKEILQLISRNEQISGKPDEVSIFLQKLFFKDFSYSMSPGEYDLEEGLDDFLFNRKVGFCGHFTTASAILFRLFRVPSRVIIGYQGGEYNVLGEFYTVTKKQAHAWVEYLGNDGTWKRFDPVSFIAPHRIQYGADSFYSFLSSSGISIQEINKRRNNLFSKWKQFIKNIYYQSGTMFFNYDLESQKKIFKSFKKIKAFTIFKYFLIAISPFILFFIVKLNFINITLYLVLRKYGLVKSWRDFRYLTISEINGSRRVQTVEKFKDFISKYEKITYTKQYKGPYKLSFIFDGLKMLLYEKST
jgi:transglutaminase-like putative cysteine protease